MKPILLSTDMVRAILEDRKTVTRRVVKPQPKDLSDDQLATKWLIQRQSPYRPGDILYVRETFWKRADNGEYSYKADVDNPSKHLWCPSIHMPREAARIFLRVTDVRVERLRDITVEGVVREGTPKPTDDEILTMKDGDIPPFCWFAKLWNSTVRPADRALYGWDANPWVWVIAFERISREEAIQNV